MGNVSRLFEKKVQELRQVKPRVVFVLKPVLRLELKDPISYVDKSCIIYKFNCFCERSYNGQTSRCLKTRVKHIPKFIKVNTTNKTKAVVNAIKRSSITEHLFDSVDCAKLWFVKFKVINNCTNSIDLVR